MPARHAASTTNRPNTQICTKAIPDEPHPMTIYYHPSEQKVEVGEARPYCYCKKHISRGHSLCANTVAFGTFPGFCEILLQYAKMSSLWGGGGGMCILFEICEKRPFQKCRVVGGYRCIISIRVAYLSGTDRNMPTRSVFRDRRDCCLVCAR